MSNELENKRKFMIKAGWYPVWKDPYHRDYYGWKYDISEKGQEWHCMMDKAEFETLPVDIFYDIAMSKIRELRENINQSAQERYLAELTKAMDKQNDLHKFKQLIFENRNNINRIILSPEMEYLMATSRDYAHHFEAGGSEWYANYPIETEPRVENGYILVLRNGDVV